MTSVALFAAAGALTWVLRAAFITLLPARHLPVSVLQTLRYAAPAAFAGLLGSALADGPSATVWKPILASSVAALVAWRLRNLMATVAAGALAISVLALI
jgi:branched-subunit amino acid transport protein